MFSIAIIDTNGYEIEEKETLQATCKNIIEATKELKDNLKNVVKIITVNTPYEMLEKITEIIGLTPDMMGMNTTVYENDDYIYQLCHVDSQSVKDKPINAIASTITYDKIRVFGKAVLYRSIMKENNIFMPSSVTIKDVEDILDIRTKHYGIFIKADSSYDERSFIIDPVECCYDFKGNEKEKKLITHIMRIVNFPIIVIYDKDSKDEQNKLISKMTGLEINGNAFLFIKNGNHDFINLNLDLFNKIKLLVDNDKLKELTKTYDFKYMISQYRKITELQIDI